MFVSLAELEDLQLMIRERDEKVAELTALREDLERERLKAAELQREIEFSKELELSERQRLVCLYVLHHHTVA